jgi:hypothetical protein
MDVLGQTGGGSPQGAASIDTPGRRYEEIFTTYADGASHSSRDKRDRATWCYGRRYRQFGEWILPES